MPERRWFPFQGCYVIGGVPTYWRDSRSHDSKPGFQSVYDALNMIQPWTIPAASGGSSWGG